MHPQTHLLMEALARGYTFAVPAFMTWIPNDPEDPQFEEYQKKARLVWRAMEALRQVADSDQFDAPILLLLKDKREEAAAAFKANFSGTLPFLPNELHWDLYLAVKLLANGHTAAAAGTVRLLMSKPQAADVVDSLKKIYKLLNDAKDINPWLGQRPLF